MISSLAFTVCTPPRKSINFFYVLSIKRLGFISLLHCIIRARHFSPLKINLRHWVHVLWILPHLSHYLLAMVLPHPRRFEPKWPLAMRLIFLLWSCTMEHDRDMVGPSLRYVFDERGWEESRSRCIHTNPIKPTTDCLRRNPIIRPSERATLKSQVC